MKIRIDPFQSLEQQLIPIIKRMPEFLPIKPMNPPHETNLDNLSQRGSGGKKNINKKGDRKRGSGKR